MNHCGSPADEKLRVEDELRATNALLDVLRGVHLAFIRGGDAGELFDSLLGQLLQLTESEYGFIGEVHLQEDGTPFLQTHAITNIAWNEETRRFYEEHGPQGLRFHNLQTLFGAVMTSKLPVIANAPAEDPRRGGLPEGHPDLRAFLGLPFFKGERMVGMVGMANRPNGYDEELVAFLEPVLVTCSGIIEAYRSDRSRMAAEAAVREREERLDILVESLVDAVITIDERGAIESVNSAAVETFGYSAEELIGRNVSMLMPAPFRQEHDSYLAQYRETGVKHIIGIGREVEGLRKDGSVFPLELAVSEARFRGERVFTGVLRDITERKRAEAELREQAEVLRRRNQEQQEFLRVASHDLQEPLRRLRTYGELLRQDVGGELPPEAEADLRFLVESAEQAHALVRDLAALATTGNAELHLDRVPLDDCVDASLKRLADILEATGASIEREELPAVWGDANLLNLVFENLISNAVKFSDTQTPAVRLSAKSTGDTVCLAVRDDGIGVDARHADTIFSPFKRLHAKGTYEGSGIGLTLCRKALDRLGGRIWLEESEGPGACFKFTLKAADEGGQGQ